MPKKHVLTLEQMKTMASPVRQRIIASLMARAKASIAEVAGDMFRRPDTLYHHFRLLQGVGLIEVIEDRIAGKNREAVYACVAPSFTPEIATADPPYLEAFARLVQNVLADAANHHAQAYADRKKRERTLFETANVRLSPSEIEQLNEELAALLAKYKQASREDGERHFFTLLSTPVGKT